VNGQSKFESNNATAIFLPSHPLDNITRGQDAKLAGKDTMYVKQCDCLLALLVDDDFCGRPDKFDPLYIFQDKMQFQIFKKIFY
jgi:hypothetical protein